jgi:VIT1/CCC1 family predicted Fe2+/Mn2+ transporter
MSDGTRTLGRHHFGEAHMGHLGGRMNWLRAGVLGANDGLVSTAGLVVGVAGATSSLSTILTAGLAGLVAGSLSMAGGEYVSVSTQRDTEEAALRREREELATVPEREFAELVGIYEQRGLSPELAQQVAQELTDKDVFRAHAEAELQIDPDVLTSPLQAAGASFVAFAVGGLLPILAIVVPWQGWRVQICVAAVVAGLVVTGYSSARLGKAAPRAAMLRNVAVGILTMAITWVVGRLTGGMVG